MLQLCSECNHYSKHKDTETECMLLSLMAKFWRLELIHLSKTMKADKTNSSHWIKQKPQKPSGSGEPILIPDNTWHKKQNISTAKNKTRPAAQCW